ncbi:ribokinase [Janthinobacterium sp. CG_23.3]|uniref:ribokinase n=1 Tax=unclassified Janthinobacterium TaxID=2610881 RepID=UPI0003464AB6|nr:MULTISPECIES: ribokinase [unclassified Janthinobacterium]MEC5162094.1 ribokinase [Janthinobacterium sp. CG_S6]
MSGTSGTSGAKPRKQPRITVVGSLNMDLVFRTPRMPAAGETIAGQQFCQIPGGKGANQAVAAARLGGAVTMIGRVGDDAFGAQLRAGLVGDGIDVTHLHTQAGAASGVAGIMVDDAGRNSIVIAPGANMTLTADMVEALAPAILAADLLVCQLETPLTAVIRAIHIARRGGVTVVFNPAPMQPLRPDLVALVDYLIVNETEASQLSGTEVVDRGSARQAATRLLAMGAGAVLLTMGEQGVLIVGQGGRSRMLDAVRVDAVDTTAAGDTFVGAFAVGVGQGLDLVAAATAAQYAAALTVTKLGAQSAIPFRHEVERFITRCGGAAPVETEPT